MTAWYGMDRLCEGCQTPLQKVVGGRRFCFECAAKRNKASAERSRRRRAGEDIPYLCKLCEKPTPGRFHRTCSTCWGLEVAKNVECPPDMHLRRAGALVSKAKRKGLLPPLTGDIPCDDCGGPATQYDHRDYRYPLWVAPVCRRCNIRRGQGRKGRAA